MEDLKLELDHVGVAVRSLDEGQRAYERLGFKLAPRSLHSGAVTPGGPVVPWGSGNHCAMFRRGYLEVLGITDPGLHSSAKGLLEKYEGLHIVAFGVPDADRAYAALSARSPGIHPARALERDAAYGPEGNETRRAAFRNVYTDKDAFPEARFIFIEHLTRDVLWQPHLLDHPNGAVSIEEVALCVEDLAAGRARLTPILGVAPQDKGGGFLIYKLARGRVYVMTPEALAEWAPGVVPPRLPWVAGFGVGVADLARTRALLAAAGITFREHPYPAVWVGPAVTCGPVLSFIQAQA